MIRLDLVQPAYPEMERQDMENQRAIASLAELVENALTVAENYLSYTDGRLPPLCNKGQDLINAVHEMHLRYRHEHPCGWDESRVMERCKQKVTCSEIAEIASRPTLDIGTITTSLRQMCTTEKLPRGRYLLLKDNLVPLNRHRGQNGVANLPETLAALYDIHHVDIMSTIRDELAELHAAKAELFSRVNEAQTVYDSATSRGDVIEVERAHRHLIAARYEYTVFCAKCLGHVAHNTEDSNSEPFSDELKRLQEDAEDAVKMFQDEKESMKAALAADIAACDVARHEEEDVHTRNLAAFEEQEKDLNAELGDIVQCKVSIVEEIRRKALELRDLMEKQKEVVRAHMDMKREIEKSRTAYNEFVQLEDQHKRRLERCLAYYHGCDPVVEEMTNYVSEMVNQLPKDDVANATTQLKDAEVDSFMDAYRHFVFVCGELTVKKTHRLDTLERQARLTRHNRDSAMDSLDPNMETYRLELDDIVEQMKAVEGVINALNATQDAGEQVFESVEEFVHEKHERQGTTFVHPLQEFGIQSVDERSRFVDRSMKYVEEEEHEASHKKAQLMEMRTLVEQQAITAGQKHAADGYGAPRTAIEGP